MAANGGQSQCRVTVPPPGLGTKRSWSAVLRHLAARGEDAGAMLASARALVGRVRLSIQHHETFSTTIQLHTVLLKVESSNDTPDSSAACACMRLFLHPGVLYVCPFWLA
jgi:hypothetical protein